MAKPSASLISTKRSVTMLALRLSVLASAGLKHFSIPAQISSREFSGAENPLFTNSAPKASCLLAMPRMYLRRNLSGIPAAPIKPAGPNKNPAQNQLDPLHPFALATEAATNPQTPDIDRRIKRKRAASIGVQVGFSICHCPLSPYLRRWLISTVPVAIPG